MNCLHITLFFNIVAGIVQTFVKSWNQLLYLRVIEVCRLSFEPRHDFFSHLIIVVELFPSEMFLEEISGNRWAQGPDCTAQDPDCTADGPIYPTFSFCVEKLYDGTHLAFGGTLDRHCHFKHVSFKQAGSTTVKRARLTGKGSRSTAVLP